MNTSTTAWLRLVRRMGRGRNPLRRRADAIDAWLGPVTVLVFLLLCPLVIAVTGTLVRTDDAAIERAQSSWRPVQAVVLESAPGATQPDFGASAWQTPTPAYWTYNGQPRDGYAPAPAGARPGSALTVWLDKAGHVEDAPLTKAGSSERVVEAILSVLAILGTLLCTLMLLVRHILDRRRLASWETAWLSVGPTWSRRG